MSIFDDFTNMDYILVLAIICNGISQM